MTPTITGADLEDGSAVIYAFMEACPQPTPGQVDAWCARHPADADEIRSYAQAMVENPERDLTAEDDAEVEEISARIAGRATRRLDAARRATLPELLASRGTSVAKVATAIDIDRGILADIVAGRLLPPVGPRLVAALASALGLAREGVRAAIAASFDAPRLGFASADGDTAAGARTWEQSVAAAPISDERKAYWLAED